jgi:hypothetical protein
MGPALRGFYHKPGDRAIFEHPAAARERRARRLAEGSGVMVAAFRYACGADEENQKSPKKLADPQQVSSDRFSTGRRDQHVQRLRGLIWPTSA